MTGTRRLLAVAVALLCVLSVPAAVWALGSPASATQQEDQPTVEVTDIDAPSSAIAGQTINVTATVRLNGSTTPNATATPDPNATVNATTTPVDNATATPTPNGTNATAAVTESPSSEALTVPVEFRLEGDVLLRQNVTLEPGESRNVTFQVDTTGLDTGVYIHSVLAGNSGADSSLIIVRGNGQERPEPNPNSTSFRVSNLTAPGETTVGDTVEVTARITNPVGENATDGNGTEVPNATEAPNTTATPTPTATPNATATPTPTATPNTTATPNATEPPNATATPNATDTANTTQTVEFRVEGDVVATRNVTLGPGESTTVNFTLDTAGLAPGIYFHGVLTEDFGDMAVLRLSERTTNGTATPAPNGTATPEPNGTESPTEEPGTTAPNGTTTPAPNGTTTPAPNGTTTPAPDGTSTATEGGTATSTPTSE